MQHDSIKSNTSLGLYRSFIAVFETRSVRRAAEMTGITHSAISQNMKSLSEQLGVKLFHPHARGVEPSSEAIKLYPEIKRAIDIINSGEENIREFDRDTYAIIRLSAPSTLVSYTLMSYFKQFNQNYPNVTFELVGKNGTDLLEQRRVDFIIDFDHRFKGHSFDTTNFLSEECIFIASSEFAKANNLSNTITKEELLELPIIARREFLHNINSESDLRLNVFVSSATSETVYSMVKNSLGVGIYYKNAFQALTQTNNDILELQVKGVKLPPMKSVIAYNDITLSKAARSFIEGLLLRFGANPRHK